MSYAHLSKSQRLELSILHNKDYPQRDIAKALNVNVSTVCRELKRNSIHSHSEYNPLKANHKAYRRRKYSKFQGMKISSDSFLEDFVIRGLESGWTPEEISGRLKNFHSIILSFKSIYSWLSSVRGQQYLHYLPSKTWKCRRKNKAIANHIPNRVSIEERPGIINRRKRIGDFEGDTMGKPKHTPQTLVAAVDRKSRYLLGQKVKALKYTVEGFQAILPPKTLSLTLDNGVENVRYEELKIDTYFCHPFSSWEKGTIENTFQRIRRFIPKKANLASFSDEQIAIIIQKMNNTPRKCLDYRTPAEIFKGHLQH